MLQHWLMNMWDMLSAFWNSNFGTAVISAFIGSLAGAWGGAWAAQKIADRGKRRSQLLDEIRGCNAGIDAAGAILNEFLNLKGQQIVKLWNSFEEQRGAVEIQRIGREQGWIPQEHELHLQIDLGILPVMRMPSDLLERIMSERVTLSGRPQGLMHKVVQSIHRTNEMIAGRNALILEFNKYPERQRVPRLFGLPMGEIGQDNRYKDSMEGVWKYTNDVVYFSAELSKALTKQGRLMEERFKRKFGRVPFRTTELDFETPEARPLMPDKGDYASWEKTFITLVPNTKGRRLTKTWYYLRKGGREILRKPWRN